MVENHDLKSLSLFGSALRDDFNKNSDIDILIEFNKPEEKSLFDLIDLKIELEDVTGRKVDIVEKGSIENPYRYNEINSTARVIYAAE